VESANYYFPLNRIGIIQSLKETLDRLKDDNIESPQIRLDYLNSLLRLLKNISLDELMRNQMEVRETLFTYLGDPHYEIRATVFRIYRYLLVNQEVQSFCWKQEHMEFFINRYLSQPSTSVIDNFIS
jgi:hypothetical protein